MKIFVTAIERLVEKANKLDAEGREIFELAAKEERQLTGDERARADANAEELDGVLADIKRYERQESIQDAVSQGEPLPGPDPETRAADSQRWGSFGEFMQSVYSAGLPGNGADRRLIPEAGAATNYGNVSTGSEGGFLVPTDFATEVSGFMTEGGENLLALTDQTVVTGNSMSFPADETVPWSTTGILAYWAAEAATVTQTKPDLKERTLKLNKLMSLVPVTDELLEDAAALESYVTRKMGIAIRWKVNDAIVNGTGAGQPLGIINAPGTVTQAKESGQTADTINTTNAVKMFGRLYRPLGVGNARWLINPDAWHQLTLMTVSNQPVWVPVGVGLQSSPSGSLLGVPVVMHESCQTLGDLNDIVLCDFSQYRTIVKAAGVQMATSIHLFFDYDQVAFRATFRVDGQPWNQAGITPPNSSVTQSGFVNLAARA